MALAPIVAQIGAIEEDRIGEAMSKLTALVTKAVKDAKAKHGVGKRVRVFLKLTRRPRTTYSRRKRAERAR